MKKNIRFFVTLIFSGIVSFSCSNEVKRYTVSNTSGFDLIDKAVVLTREEVSKYVTIPEGKVVLVTDKKGKALSSQCDDLDGDGKWDELAFLTDLEAGQKKKVTLKAVDKSELPEFTKKTNIRFGDKKPPFKELHTATRLKSTDTNISRKAFQMEGPAWENDIIGFRNYFDARNGMDIYGKRVSRMALDSVGLPGKPSYHELAGWGMDILKVGNSLGAGAIGIKIGDILYRIGSSGKGKYRFINEGPVRAMFEFSFTGVKMGERTYNIKQIISIYAGDHFYRSKVTVSGLKGDEKLITGIVDHDVEFDKGKFAGYKYFYTLGPQAFMYEFLGMAVLVKKDVVSGSFSAPDSGDGIIKTHVVSLNRAC